MSAFKVLAATGVPYGPAPQCDFPWCCVMSFFPHRSPPRPPLFLFGALSRLACRLQDLRSLIGPFSRVTSPCPTPLETFPFCRRSPFFPLPPALFVEIPSFPAKSASCAAAMVCPPPKVGTSSRRSFPPLSVEFLSAFFQTRSLM